MGPIRPSGAVVDARGILPDPNISVFLGCSSNPFSGVTVPSTILLPATNIQIAAMWTLPSNPTLIGEGAGPCTIPSWR